MDSTIQADTQAMIMKCSGCGKTYRVHPDKLPPGVSSFPCRACGTLVAIEVHKARPPADDGKTVLVAVEEEDLARLIQRILGVRGYTSHAVNTGVEALQALKEGGNDLLLVSVFLPDMMGYEVLDRLSDGKYGPRVPSILLSSVHHAARYKRAPTSLYGADDYLERHHLPDLLIPKIEHHLSVRGKEAPRPSPADLPALTDEQVQQRRDLERMESAEQGDGDPQLAEIQRMCRVIAGDIALYNEDVIRTIPPGDLMEAIGKDLREGETLLVNRFPEWEERFSSLLVEEMQRLLRSRGIELP